MRNNHKNFSYIFQLYFYNRKIMEILKLLALFASGFFTLLIMDTIWLGYVLHNFIIREFWALVVVQDGGIKINLGAGLIAWALIVLTIMIFVTKTPYGATLSSSVLYGWLLWGLLYGVYDFTNLTFLKNYSLTFSIVDTLWGVVLCATISLVMYYVSKAL